MLLIIERNDLQNLLKQPLLKWTKFYFQIKNRYLSPYDKIFYKKLIQVGTSDKLKNRNIKLSSGAR